MILHGWDWIHGLNDLICGIGKHSQQRHPICDSGFSCQASRIFCKSWRRSELVRIYLSGPPGLPALCKEGNGMVLLCNGHGKGRWTGHDRSTSSSKCCQKCREPATLWFAQTGILKRNSGTLLQSLATLADSCQSPNSAPSDWHFFVCTFPWKEKHKLGESISSL